MSELEYLRAYAAHLKDEHRDLHKLVCQVQDSLTQEAQQSNPSTPEPGEMLVALSNRLQQHFAEEEAEGCLEAAVCKRPALASEAKSICAEHQTLLKTLESLIVRSSQEPWKNLIQDFHNFCEQLVLHEEKEAKLLQAGFNESLL